MDARKIVEVLRATLDANQQQQAHDQLQQVRIDSKTYDLKTNHMSSLFCAQTFGSIMQNSSGISINCSRTVARQWKMADLESIISVHCPFPHRVKCDAIFL